MKLLNKAKMAVVPLTTTAMVMIPSVCAFASESGSSDSVDIRTITTETFGKLQGDMTFIVGVAAAAAIALIGITVGVAFLIKRAKGLKSQAG